MSFLYNSVFGSASSSLQKDATVFSTLANKFDPVGLGCLLADGRRWKTNILYKMRRHSGDVIEKLHGLWSFVQTSSFIHPSHSWKIMLVEELCHSQLFSETFNKLQSAVERMPSLQKILEQLHQGELGTELIFEDLNGLEGVSDVIRDFIKTVKVLMTHDTVVDVQEDFLGILPAIQCAVREKHKIRRYIG